MNLAETLQALEAKDIQIALDLGVHQRCLLDSNCPKAVELRKLLGEAGIGLPEILEGYQQLIAPDPFEWSGDGFQIDGKVTVRVAGRDIQLDLTQTLEDSLNVAIRRMIDNIKGQEHRVRGLGRSLYSRYLEEITKQRRDRALPQLSFNETDLLKYNIMITSDGDNYIFLSLALYRPEYIVRDGIRYELSTDDKKALREEVILRIIITRGNNFLSATLLQFNGQKFEHYHGRHGDCWGAIKMPGKWDRSLRGLDRLKIQLFNALVTINYNSLVSREPPGKPYINQLLERSTELGREGILEETTEPAGTRLGRAGTRWGAR